MVMVKPCTVRGHDFPSQKHAIMWLHRLGLKRPYIAEEVGTTVAYVTSVLSRSKARTGREKAGDGNSGHVAERGVWVNGTKYASMRSAIVIMARGGYSTKRIAEIAGISEAHVRSEISRANRKMEAKGEGSTQPRTGAHWGNGIGYGADFIGCKAMRHKTCQWLDFEDPSTDEAMCGTPVAPGRSYCHHHYARSISPSGTFIPGVGALK